MKIAFIISFTLVHVLQVFGSLDGNIGGNNGGEGGNSGGGKCPPDITMEGKNQMKIGEGNLITVGLSSPWLQLVNIGCVFRSIQVELIRSNRTRQLTITSFTSDVNSLIITPFSLAPGNYTLKTSTTWFKSQLSSSIGVFQFTVQPPSSLQVVNYHTWDDHPNTNKKVIMMSGAPLSLSTPIVRDSNNDPCFQQCFAPSSCQYTEVTFSDLCETCRAGYAIFQADIPSLKQPIEASFSISKNGVQLAESNCLKEFKSMLDEVFKDNIGSFVVEAKFSRDKRTKSLFHVIEILEQGSLDQPQFLISARYESPSTSRFLRPQDQLSFVVEVPKDRSLHDFQFTISLLGPSGVFVASSVIYVGKSYEIYFETNENDGELASLTDGILKESAKLSMRFQDYFKYSVDGNQIRLNTVPKHWPIENIDGGNFQFSVSAYYKPYDRILTAMFGFSFTQEIKALGSCEIQESEGDINTVFAVVCQEWDDGTGMELKGTVFAILLENDDQKELVQTLDLKLISAKQLTLLKVADGNANSKIPVKLPPGRPSASFAVAVVVQIVNPETKAFINSFAGMTYVRPFNERATESEKMEQILNFKNNLETQDRETAIDSALQLSSMMGSVKESFKTSNQTKDEIQQAQKDLKNVREIIVNSMYQMSDTMTSDQAHKAVTVVKSILKESSDIESKTTQSAAALMKNAAKTFLKQAAQAEVSEDQIQTLLDATATVVQANIAQRQEVAQMNQANRSTVLADSRNVIQKVTESVQLLGAITAKMMIIGEEPKLLETGLFNSLVKKTSVDSIGSIQKNGTLLISKLSDALAQYDFGRSNPGFDPSTQAIIAQLVTYKENPFASLSTGEDRNRSSVVSLTLSDDNGNELVIRNTSEGIRIKFYSNPFFEYSVDFTKFNVSTIQFGADVQVINSTTDKNRNLTTFLLAPKCQYWDFNSSSWQTDGCSFVASESTSTMGVCSCTHLTSFSMAFGSPMDILGIRAVFPPLKPVSADELFERIIVIQVMSGILGVYIVGVIALNLLQHSKAKAKESPPPNIAKMNFFQKTWKIFSETTKEEHVWFSVLFDRSNDNTFSRVQRWTVGFTIMLVNLTVITAFYIGSLPAGNAPQQSSLIADIVTGIIVSAITFPFTFLMIRFFRRPREILETEAGRKSVRNLSIIGYIVTLGLMALSIYFLLQYSTMLPVDQVNSWLISYGSSFAEGMFLSNPIKALIITFLSTCGCMHPKYLRPQTQPRKLESGERRRSINGISQRHAEMEQNENDDSFDMNNRDHRKSESSDTHLKDHRKSKSEHRRPSNMSERQQSRKNSKI